MINPYLFVQLRRARNVLRKCGEQHLVNRCHDVFGAMLDTTSPENAEIDARELIHLALGGTIHA